MVRPRAQNLHSTELTHITGTRSSSRWQKAEEEVVKGQRYVAPSRFSAYYHRRLHTPTPRTRICETTVLIFNPLIVKDKANHAVILDKATSDKLYKDVQSYRLITVATLVDRLKINGSLARKALSDLEEKGQIKKVVGHSKLSIYSKRC